MGEEKLIETKSFLFKKIATDKLIIDYQLMNFLLYCPRQKEKTHMTKINGERTLLLTLQKLKGL